MKRLIIASVSTLALAQASAAQDGFSIVIDGDRVAGDRTVTQSRQKADQALAKADLAITFDGLEPRPTLGLELQDQPGGAVQVTSRMNYPAFVTRGEVVIIDPNTPTGAKIVQRMDLPPNGTATLTPPKGQDLLIAHRVYDAQGRMDATAPIPLFRKTAAAQADLPTADTADQSARRRIPVVGGAVTVRGENLRPGSAAHTLGETLRPDASGRFVVQRILPPGDVPVSVQIKGAGDNTYLEREIRIPRSEWFHVGIVDLTFGKRFDPGVDSAGEQIDDTYSHGRIAGYAKGRTASGWVLTGRIDTGEEPLDQLFDDRDDKDVASVLDRLDPNAGYSEFGDDSTLEDGAPSRGKVYLRAEKDGSHIQWGTSKSTIAGAHYLRNERSLYGLQGVYRSPATTRRGDARFTFEGYAAQPDTLPGRDTFRGTGGSVYFLQRQDIVMGSETVTVELRDPDTGRVVESRQLSAGADYQINAVQGLVTLSAPLGSRTGSRVVQGRPGGDYDVRLTVQYEFSPTSGDLDGYSYGARIEGWATDDLRLGVTGLVEQTDLADQTAAGVDLRYHLGETSVIDLEYAETNGPGFGAATSDDGGLVIRNSGATSGTGSAVRAAVTLDLAEFGAATPGSLQAYYEGRTAGFNTLDHQTTVDELLWGVSIGMQPSESVSWRLAYDAFEDDTGKRTNEGSAELSLQVSERIRWDLGLAHLDKRTPGGADDENGSRTDLAARVTLKASDVLSWYLFGQATVDRSGGLRKNDRFGVGLSYQFANNWTFEGELSDGTLGTGGQAILTYSADGQNTAYAGYRLTPGREFSGVALRGRDQGQYVAGGKRQVNDQTSVYAENTYDLFGRHRSLTSRYGIEYRPDALWTLFASYDMGRVQDDANGDVDRNALSVGFAYSDSDRITLRGRVELRQDRGDTNGQSQDQDAVLVKASGQIKLDDAQRLRFNLSYADITADNASFRSGAFVDASVGYALRPVTHDRLNLLFQYRYFYDMVGQDIDGTAGRGPRQESHVVSLDAEYSLNPMWTIGGKLGGRWSQSAPDDTTPLADNDAWLAVLNARWHMTHKWDALIEGRVLQAEQAGFRDTGVLGAIYRHVGKNAKIGVGYNFGNFSDDLTDLTYDDKGAFINLIAKF